MIKERSSNLPDDQRGTLDVNLPDGTATSSQVVWVHLFLSQLDGPVPRTSCVGEPYSITDCIRHKEARLSYELTVESIFVEKLEQPLVAALSHVVLSQQMMGKNKAKEACMGTAICKTRDCVDALSAIVENCDRADIETSIIVEGQIGRYGWETLENETTWR